MAITFSLRAFAHFLSNSEVLWRTDNYAASLIVPSGSRVEKLQLLAEDIYEFCSQRRISLTVEWIPRRFIQTADALSKLPDYDDWETTWDFFNELSELWGPFDIDRLLIKIIQS